MKKIIFQRKLIYIFSIITLCFLFMNNCTSCNSGPAASIPLPGLKVGGDILEPAETTDATLIKDIHFVTLSQTGVAVDFSIYNISHPPADGGPIATGTSEADGSFSVQLDEDDINAGDMLVVEASNGITGMHVLPTSLDDITEYTFEDTDFDTTLSLEQFKNKLGADVDWADFDIADVELDADAQCLIQMANEQWKNADLESQSGLQVSLGFLRIMMAAAFKQGEFDTYASLTEMLQAFLDNTLDDDFAEQVAAAAEAAFGGDTDTYESNWGYGTNAYAIVSEILKNFYATASDDDDSFCNLAKADSDYLQNALQGMINTTNATTFQSTFGSVSAVTFLQNLLEAYNLDGDYDFTSDELDYLWNSVAFGSLLEASEGDFSDLSVDTFLNLLNHLPETDDEDFSYGNWGLGLMSLYLDYISNDLSLSSEDIENLAGYMAYQTESGVVFDITSDDFSSYSWRSNYEAQYAQAIAAGQSFGSCLTNPTTCATSLGSDYYMQDWEQYSSRACNFNGTCDSNESFRYCAYDCGQTFYSQEFADATCGDDTCSGGIEYYTCPADCTSGSTGYCGDGTCGTAETMLTCISDCYEPSECGDDVCAYDENFINCSDDCVGTFCGDDTCNGTETTASCPADCGYDHQYAALNGAYTVTFSPPGCSTFWGAAYQLIAPTAADHYSASNGIALSVSDSMYCEASRNGTSATYCTYSGYGDEAYDDEISISFTSCQVTYTKIE